MNLSTNDYKKIVEFYNIKKNKNQSYKHVAEKTLANKLCRCIKKVKKNIGFICFLLPQNDLRGLMMKKFSNSSTFLDSSSGMRTSYCSF